MQGFLAEHGIPYVEKDVSKDEAALNELMELGFYSTPVTLIAGEAVVGFDRKKLGALLGIG